MSTKTELSKQQKKSQETRKKSFRQRRRFFGRVDMKNCRSRISVKKQVCRTEVSIINFKTKDDLLSYYIEDQPTMGPDLLETPKKSGRCKGRNCPCLFELCNITVELGVEFMAGYYDTKNQALNPAIRTERPYPIVTVQAYVEQAAKDGIINVRESIDEFTTDIRMIVIGNVFEWCLRKY